MKKYAHEIKWGVIFTVVSLLWMVLEKMFGWHDELISKHPIYTNIFAILAIAIFVFALLEKRKKLGGFMTWKEGFVSGLIISVVAMILTPLSQVITHKVISPSYFPNAIQYSVESGNATQAEAEAFFTLPSYMMQSALGAIIMGAVTAAIVALILQRKKK
ncbi:MAG: DUF4199 domain-containing protein [Bacteroidia bacterium]